MSSGNGTEPSSQDFNPGSLSDDEIRGLFWTLRNEMKLRGLSVTTHPWPPPERAAEGNARCLSCGAWIAWEGELPADCLKCGGPVADAN